MAKRPSATLIGGFILGAALLFVAAVAVWGSGRLWEKRYAYVCYFPGSVTGLNVGAAVRYRGVQVGQVTGMRIRFQQPETESSIPVFIEIQGKRLHELGVTAAPTGERLKELIGRGLRARLQAESFVTGQLFVSLDLFPDTPVRLIHGQDQFPEIPTVPTSLEEVTRSLTTVLAHLKEADLAGMAHSLSSAIEGINRLVNTPSVARTLAELPSTVAAARQLLRNFDSGTSDLEHNLQSTLAARGPIILELQRALVDVQHAAEAVRGLAEFLQRNPNAIITGKRRP